VLPTVRSVADPLVETITRGNSSVKIASTLLAMTNVVTAKAQPSRRSATSQAAPMAPSTAPTSTTLSSTPLCAMTCVQKAKTATMTATNGALRRAARPARSRTSPVVFRAMKVAPCSTQIASKVSPTHSA
jgi:hypothetical protein